MAVQPIYGNAQGLGGYTDYYGFGGGRGASREQYVKSREPAKDSGGGFSAAGAYAAGGSAITGGASNIYAGIELTKEANAQRRRARYIAQQIMEASDRETVESQNAQAELTGQQLAQYGSIGAEYSGSPSVFVEDQMKQSIKEREMRIMQRFTESQQILRASRRVSRQAKKRATASYVLGALDIIGGGVLSYAGATA